jgi:hypothetical protein
VEKAMSVSLWDVNRKIPWNKLLKDVRAGKYNGAKVSNVNIKSGYFMIAYGKHEIEVDRDGLLNMSNGKKRTGYPTGIADRFDITLPGFNRGGADAIDKFTGLLEKEYGSKFLSDFEMESPEREWTRHTDVKSNIHPNEKPLPKDPFKNCQTIEYSKEYPKGRCLDRPVNRPKSVIGILFGKK